MKKSILLGLLALVSFVVTPITLMASDVPPEVIDYSADGGGSGGNDPTGG